ncbi:choice-of-anchor I domain-containing protein [Membranihabitans marinus]|uniref:choice-of-anchor I domain-containing protein n=1 Tax=Membranihabitans marinus TaxID=1227546 RepID=UPI001F374334|nr:esterase-like activity of phytase family protein [Membranihabitans marinus]
MKKNLLLLTVIIINVVCSNLLFAQIDLPIQRLSSYSTQTEGSAEVVAYDKNSKRVFFTSSANNSFTILDISNPTSPQLIKEIPLHHLGGGPNSIATNNGIVAIAIENDTKVENGFVALYDTAGVFLDTVTVGSLPDMLTFTPDGSKIIVANEGEPNDDYNIDPLGSISIVDLASRTAITYDFTSFNERKQELINKGIRIFGDNGTTTVAQDLEPEYITIVKDGSLAYVNCQENNALAVFDLETKEFIDILPLGYKDHYLGSASVQMYNINERVNNWPALGQPLYNGGQDTVFLGGFSGLCYDASASNDSISVFFVIPDRGPNDAPVAATSVTPAAPKNLRPFKLPNYQGRIVKFSINHSSGEVSLDQQIPLFRQDGITPISGKGNIPGEDEVPVTYTDTTTPYGNADFIGPDGKAYHLLPYDEMGGDFEGIIIDKNQSFWMCDEYRPALYKFDSTGVLIDRYVPKGNSLQGTTPQPEGTYGNETLPATYAKRWANRGFEAIAYDSTNNIIYTFIQSPLYNRNSSTKNNSDIIRILGVNAENGQPIAEFVYLLEGNKNQSFGTSRVDKIGDAVYKGEGKFLVVERDSEVGNNPHGKKYIFEIDLLGATNIFNSDIATSTGTGDITPLEEMTADELFANGIQPVHKTKVVNLPSIGYYGSDKTEGIAILPNNKIAVINDNDFGLAGAGVIDESVLGILSFNGDYGFDASDRDDSINIQPQPTLGMFLPDGIACYSVNGMDYIVTANEGDSRDYDGYSEEERVKDLTLDSVAYPNKETLMANENIGRLKTTTANGDYDGNGSTDQIYSYGARSFSIFDKYGNLIYDSGQQFEEITRDHESEVFNEDEGEFDGRSDDKGIEPEAITIGQIGEFTYAFIGLERQSAIIVYDITDPFNPYFITYYNNRGNGNDSLADIAPEIIEFIPASESPNNNALLIVGYEVSGSVGILQLTDELTTTSQLAKEAKFSIYPNPVTDNHSLYFDQILTGKIISMDGKVIQSFEAQKQISVAGLKNGIYVIQSDKGIQRFIKL